MKHELKAIYIIWLREIIRYWRNWIRSVSSLIMPILWLVILGSGISASLSFAPSGTESFNYINFIFPGILAMIILFSSIFGALTIVYDREFGFSKEFFVAPISRTSIVIGKILGGATTATIQASLMLLLTPLIGIKISFLTIIILFPAMFLIAFGMSSLGVLLASQMKSTESFPMVMQFIMMPMFFLSGALFPLQGVPAWLAGLAQFNPLTYGVNILRHIIFSGEDISKEIIQSFSTTIFGQSLTFSISLLIFLSFTLIVVSLSAISFNRIE
ncbi:MAG TPA: ABC transporter [Candidatus Nealsonbacteria bacterium]|uniref:ABC transmembrane type-2 domain-containing protein n=1 Tax=marine sediment metagenome TaxID=412755 RepID=A0A0F9YEA0_9ZZZZ|nr:ABC transporter [Candidatus Nealsonbacteria bacterium]HEB46801.1 ABC transporter [Candidatus Nealsonbacteria bacterium]